jgi:hypothetical protein
MQVTVTFEVQEEKILDSPIISSTESRSIVSFSTRLIIRDPNVSSNTAASLDSSIIFELMTETKVGISGLLEEQEDKYGVDVFECDQDNNRLPVVRPKSQQEPLRLCFEPDEIAKNDAVGMYGIVSLTLDDGQNTQEVMLDSSVQISSTTQYSCTPDAKMCYVETSIQNSFFVTQQTVRASGVAGLQYVQDNGRRGLVQAPTQVRRRTRTAGGPAGQIPFDLAFAVEPSTSTYDARAYMCDQSQKELTEAKIEPKKHGERVFICVAPTQDATNQGIFIRDIKSFVFTKDGEEQLLDKSSSEASAEIVDGDGDNASTEKVNNGVQYSCSSGDAVCSFGIVFSGSFFNGNGEPIIGEGEVELQFGSGKATWERRLTVSSSSDRNFIDRSLQENDPDFAGVAPVTVTIPVDPTSIAPSAAWASQSLNFWTSIPTYARVIIILGIVLGVMVCIFVAWCFIYGFDSYHFNPFVKPNDDLVCDFDYEDQEPDFTDPENLPMDTVEGLKDEGRGRPRELGDRKRSQMRSHSRGRNANDSVTTKSVSSLSESNPANGRGRSRDPGERKKRSISPTRCRSSNGKFLKSKSFDDRIDTEIKPAQRAKARSTSEERFRSVPPSSGSRAGAVRPASTQSFIGLGGKNRGKQSRSKGPGKPASIDNLLGLFGKTGHWDQSPVTSRWRARSGSPIRAIRSSIPMKSSSVHKSIVQNERKPNAKKSSGKLLKPAISPQKKAGECSMTKKSASTNGLRKTSAKESSSADSRTRMPNASSSSHSRKKTSKALMKKDTVRGSAHSVGSCSSVSEESVNSGAGSRMTGIKNDVVSTNSTHSAQSFASSSGSFCSTDSEMDLSTDTNGVIRVKGKMKKKKGTKISNSYDIVNGLA